MLHQKAKMTILKHIHAPPTGLGSLLAGVYLRHRSPGRSNKRSVRLFALPIRLPELLESPVGEVMDDERPLDPGSGRAAGRSAAQGGGTRAAFHHRWRRWFRHAVRSRLGPGS